MIINSPVSLCYRIIRGGNGLCDGKVATENLPGILEKINVKGFCHAVQVKYYVYFLKSVFSP